MDGNPSPISVNVNQHYPPAQHEGAIHGGFWVLPSLGRPQSNLDNPFSGVKKRGGVINYGESA
jgi:hypothetical protein